jgi:hypothetical protein
VKSHVFTETEYRAVLECSIDTTVGFFFLFVSERTFFFLKSVLVPLKNYFKNLVVFTILHFLASLIRIFSCAIQNIDKQGTSVLEVKSEVNKLLV